MVPGIKYTIKDGEMLKKFKGYQKYDLDLRFDPKMILFANGEKKEKNQKITFPPSTWSLLLMMKKKMNVFGPGKP